MGERQVVNGLELLFARDLGPAKRVRPSLCEQQSLGPNVRRGSQADIEEVCAMSALPPESGHCLARLTCLLWARSRHTGPAQPRRLS